MKKIGFLFTLSVIATLLLTACGGGGAANGTGTPDVLSTMPVEEVGTSVPTMDTGGALDQTPTTETGGLDMSEMPTVVAEVTETPLAGADTQVEGQFVLLSDLLNMQVNAADGSQLGMVSGVVVDRPIPVTGDDASDDKEDLDVTPEALPEATSDSDTLSGDTGSTDDQSGSLDASGLANQAPAIAFLVIDQSGSLSSDSDTSTLSDATPEASPEATSELDTSSSDMGSTNKVSGNEVLVPWQAVSTDSSAVAGDAGQPQALLLTIDSAALASAPAFDESTVGSAGWDSEVKSFWAGEGLAIPATGEGSEGLESSSMIMGGPINTMSVTGDMSETFGSVSDFVVDLMTGQIRYAVLSTTDQMDTIYLVPTSLLSWDSGTGSEINTFSLNVANDAFGNAPSFSSTDEIDFSNLETVDTYWQDESLNK